MARKKPTSRAASRSSAQKKSPARKAAGKPAGKTAVKSSARKKLKTKARAVPAAKHTRPKQRIAISHYRDEDFKADGLRAYAHYRDLGVAAASQGAGAGARDPADRSLQSGRSFKTAFPRRRIPDGLCAQGLGEDLLEGQGETLMKAGSAWTQPPQHQAPDPGLFRRCRIAGSDPARGVQDGRTGGVSAVNSAPPRSRPSGRSSACPRRSISIRAN